MSQGPGFLFLFIVLLAPTYLLVDYYFPKPIAFAQDVIPPSGAPVLDYVYRGVPIYQGEWSYMGGGDAYYHYFYYKDVLYSTSHPGYESPIVGTLEGKIDELLSTDKYSQLLWSLMICALASGFLQGRV